MRDDVIGAVLAGGAGSRIGSPKASLRIGDETFLQRIVGTLRAVFDEVIVCGGAGAPDGVDLVPDSDSGLGPLAGLVSALDHAGGRSAFLIAVDMPLVSRVTIDQVCNARLFPSQARVARVWGRVQPLCGMYAGDLVDLARERLGSDDRSMMGFVRSVPHLTLVDVTDGSLFNVNTPEDLARLESDIEAQSRGA